MTARRSGRRGAAGRAGGPTRSPGDPRAGAADDDRAVDPEPDPETVARAIALRRLSAAPQTRAQLDDAMRRRGVPDDVRDRVLDRFGEVGLIDDAMFARMWVESRHAGRGLAKRALAHELRQRGVDSALTDQAVADLTAEQEEATARALVVRRLATTRGMDPAKRARRLAGMLARKGYPAGLAFRLVREGLAAEGVDEGGLPDESGW